MASSSSSMCGSDGVRAGPQIVTNLATSDKNFQVLIFGYELVENLTNRGIRTNVVLPLFFVATVVRSRYRYEKFTHIRQTEIAFGELQ